MLVKAPFMIVDVAKFNQELQTFDGHESFVVNLTDISTVAKREDTGNAILTLKSDAAFCDERTMVLNMSFEDFVSVLSKREMIA